MGILDLFAKKEDVVKDMKSFSKEVGTQISQLESLSVKLNEQTLSVQQLETKSLPQELAGFIESLESHQQKILDVQTAISTFTLMNAGDSSLQQQLAVVERNIAAMNVMLEKELRDANNHLKLLNKFCNDFNKPVENLHTLLEKVARLHEKLEILHLKSDKITATVEESNTDTPQE